MARPAGAVKVPTAIDGRVAKENDDATWVLAFESAQTVPGIVMMAQTTLRRLTGDDVLVAAMSPLHREQVIVQSSARARQATLGAWRSGALARIGMVPIRWIAQQNPPADPEDPQKGRWGGLPEREGRRLNATVLTLREDRFRILLEVLSTDPDRPLHGDIVFHLHPTFKNARKVVKANANRAALHLGAWGAFTVGAEADGGQTRLELDLAQLRGLPEAFLDEVGARWQREDRPAEAHTRIAADDEIAASDEVVAPGEASRARSRLPDDLAKRLDPVRDLLHRDRNSVLVVVGSGLSRGLPSFRQLLASLIREVPDADHREKLARDLYEGSYQKIPSAISRLVGPHRLSYAIARAYQRPRVTAPAVHDLIAALPVTRFLTTSFDPWLKNAVARRFGQSPRVYTPLDAKELLRYRSRNTRPFVVMLYGDAERPETCMVSLDDPRMPPRQHKRYLQAVEAVASTRSLLFIGRSFADLDLQLLLGEYWPLLMGSWPERSWFLGTGRSQQSPRMLRDLGPTPLEVGPEGDDRLLEPSLRYLASPGEPDKRT
jgi:SIR2-like domain